MKKIDAAYLGKISYGSGLEMMKIIQNQVKNGENEAILLMEHNPVITIGRNGNINNLLFSESEYKKRGIELFNVKRGGDVTFHGPGILMGYPVCKVDRKVRDLVDKLFVSLIEILGDSGIISVYDSNFPGLWIENNKIAAVGIEINGGVSMHGFALNVKRKFEGFKMIIPCGLENKGVTYWSDFGKTPEFKVLAHLVSNHFSKNYGKSLNWLTPEQFSLNRKITHLL
jgi:lipoyl(octanoyl) transferase